MTTVEEVLLEAATAACGAATGDGNLMVLPNQGR
jgi:hypothetical protein